MNVSDRNLFRIGFIGLMLVFCWIPTSFMMQAIIIILGISAYNLINVMLSPLIGVCVCLSSVAFLGYWRRYNQITGLMVFISSTVLIIPATYVIVTFTPLLPISIDSPLFPLVYLPSFFIGVMYLYWGIGLLRIGYRNRLGRLTLATGVLFLAYGAILTPIFVYLGITAQSSGGEMFLMGLLGIALCLSLVIFKREAFSIGDEI